jgi:hypothetical protein
MAARPCSFYAAAKLDAVVDTRKLPEGPHDLRVEAQDAASNYITRTYHLDLDRTPPEAPEDLRLDGPDRWRRENHFSLAWINPVERAVAPIDSAAYELCPEANAPSDHSRCVPGVRLGRELTGIEDLAVPGDGAWRVRVALRDAAGNVQPDSPADVAGLRLDSQAPIVSFLPFDATAPSIVRLSASDLTSGIERVEIEARRRGETLWHSLPVEPTSTGAIAPIDDNALAEGTYELRAHVVDRAGNERTASALADGTPLTVTLPVRTMTALVVGHPERVRVKSTEDKTRYRDALVSRPKVAFDQRVTLRGSLRDLTGNPRGSAVVNVLERVSLPGTAWRTVAELRTDATGAFEYRAQPGPGRALRFRYAGSPFTLPSEADVELLVAAGATLVPDRRNAHNGDSVLFRGRLPGRPLPPGGKLLSLQAQTRHGWRTFATPRARQRDGRWEFRYRFTGTPTTARYAFRLVVPAESGYPYTQGISPVATVLVRGG